MAAKIDWRNVFKESGLTLDEFNKEVLLHAAVTMSYKIDQKEDVVDIGNGREMIFSFDDVQTGGDTHYELRLKVTTE